MEPNRQGHKVDMDIILAADIFGKTGALEEIATHLPSETANITMIDPYAGRRMQFADEAQAYGYFQEYVGLIRYKKIILEAITQTGCNLKLVGFSVGASAIWTISGNDFPGKHIEAACFYGSQIRHHVEISPKFPAVLYFPQHEDHFDVSTLISELAHKKFVTCEQVPYRHGFMNRKSINFDEHGYLNYLKILKNWT